MRTRKIVSALLAVAMAAAMAVPVLAAGPGARAVRPAQTSGFTEPQLLTRQSVAPDLLTMLDGTPVDSAAQWAERRKEIRAMLEYYFYGPVPIYNGDYYEHTITDNTISVGLRGGASPDTTRNLANVTITYPSGEMPEGGWPLFLGLDVSNAAFWRGMGYATANIPASNDAFRALYPHDANDWTKNTGAYGVAAYNVEMLIHALKAEAEGENRLGINPAKVGVSGASTNGKRAAAIGAMADSVWLSLPGSGGTGGVNMYRQNSANSVWDMYSGPSTLAGAPGSMGSLGNSETGIWGPIGLAEAWGGHMNWASNFGLNYGKIPELNADFAPVDAHFVAAMMARENTFYFPATGISNEGTNGVPGLQQTIDLALPVYKLLGLEDHIGARVTKAAHGVDIEASVLIMATIDHVEGRHGNCDGNCDLTPYYANSGAPSEAVQSYLNSLNFNISHMHTTPFQSQENAAAWERIQPCCNGDCEVCDCPEWCPHTADGLCCDPGVPPLEPGMQANCILIDFTGEDVDENPFMGRPRQGLGWPGAANIGSVNAEGFLQQRYTNHGGGILFNLPLGDAKLGNYDLLEFGLLISESSGAESGSDVGVTFTQDRSLFPGSGNWWDAAALAGIRINLPYAGVGVMETYRVDLTAPFKNSEGVVTGITNNARWATGNVSLAIGRNTNTQTLQFDYIKLHAIGCDEDCETCNPLGVVLDVAADKDTVRPGDYFDVTASFRDMVATNAAVVTLDYDADVFEYAGNLGEGNIPGVTYLNSEVDHENGLTKLTLMIDEYAAKELVNLRFRAREGADLIGEESTITIGVSLAYKPEEGDKFVVERARFLTLETLPALPTSYTIVDLSDAIDYFGAVKGDENWAAARRFDINNDGKIDIQDIAFIAQRIQ